MNGNYAIILTSNGYLIKHVYVSVKEESVRNEYRQIIEDNKAEIVFEKIFFSKKSLVKLDKKLYLVRNKRKDDKPRLVQDNLGKVYDETYLYNRWYILESYDYKYEETFWVSGFNKYNDRKNIMEIIGMVSDESTENASKMCMVIDNKVIFYNEKYFLTVICKNIEDGDRLYNKLKKLLKKNKSIIFFGKCGKANRRNVYMMIQKNTGLPYQKLMKTQTCITPQSRIGWEDRPVITVRK